MADSFQNAFMGVMDTIKTQRNMKIHLCVAFFVLVLSVFLSLSAVEYMILFLTITLVVMAELFNTAMEAVTDLACEKKYHSLAKTAKDAAAGAVLVTALNSIIVGYVLFFEKLAEADINAAITFILKIRLVYVVFLCFFIVLLLVILIKHFTNAENLFKGGMPSAHAAVAFCAATCILFYAKNGVIIALGYFLALLVAQSRVEGEIHSVLQASLGALLGIFATVVAFHLVYQVL